MRRFVQAVVAEDTPASFAPEVAVALAAAPARYNVAVRKPAVVIMDRGDDVSMRGTNSWIQGGRAGKC